MRCSAVRLEGALQEINASGSSCGDITGLRIRDTGPSGHVTSALLLSQRAVLYPYINHELRLVIAIEFSELEKALRKRGTSRLKIRRMSAFSAEALSTIPKAEAGSIGISTVAMNSSLL